MDDTTQTLIALLRGQVLILAALRMMLGVDLEHRGQMEQQMVEHWRLIRRLEQT